MTDSVQHIFLIGAKGFGAYGGYETFVDKLTEYHQNDTRLKYHVACKANGSGCMDETTLNNVISIIKDKKKNTVEFLYHNAHGFKIKVPNIGAAQAIYYDVVALNSCCNYIKENQILQPIVYIMACRIGPFATFFYKEIHRLGGKVYLNPDGHEWMRGKWGILTRKYWKLSEKIMVKYSDLVICDSINIEKYIHKCYDGKGLKGINPLTTFIAYGADIRKSELKEDSRKLIEWYEQNDLKKMEYYLVVGRFVPENNFETMIREFMKSKTQKKLAIVTTTNVGFMNKLEKKLHFGQDERIKFAGTVYDQELLKKIRENAYGYLHGHEVGGTNPSLLEALGSTSLNLLLDVGFNREVAGSAAVYWNKESGNLANLIDQTDQMEQSVITKFGARAKERIKNSYSWEYIAKKYERVFLLSR